MNWIALLRLWPIVPIALAGVMYLNWQKAREDVGEWRANYANAQAQVKGLKVQLREAELKIKGTAAAGAVSYGHCQDIMANDAAKNFDLGVTFGKATCPRISPPALPR